MNTANARGQIAPRMRCSHPAVPGRNISNKLSSPLGILGDGTMVPQLCVHSRCKSRQMGVMLALMQQACDDELN